MIASTVSQIVNQNRGETLTALLLVRVNWYHGRSGVTDATFFLPPEVILEI